MKIIFSQNLLNSNGESAKNIVVETKRIAQTEFAIEASSAKIFDRGNARAALLFSIERAHSSEESAFEFALSHAASIAAMSPASLVFQFEGNEEPIEFSNAVLSKIKIDTDGLISNARYEFSAQKPQ